MSSAKKSLFALGALAAAQAAAQSVSIEPVLNATATVVPPSSVWTYWNTTVSTVTVVEELTTVCAEKTTLTFNDCEYPVTKGETLVVTNCPCTLTTAVPTMTSSLCPPSTETPWYPPTETGGAAGPPGVVPPPSGEETHVPPPPPGAASKSAAAPAPTSSMDTVAISGADRRAASAGSVLGGVVAVAAAALLGAVAL